MADREVKIDTLNELKIWLEGRFDLIAANQKANADDLCAVRERLHGLSNAVTTLTALNIPEALKKMDKDIQQNQTAYLALKTTMRTAYVAIGIAGAVVGGIITIAFEAYGAFGG